MAVSPSNKLSSPADPGLPTGGTAGQVLSKNSGTDFDAAWATAAAGGLTNFTESRSTAAPNATVPAHQLAAAGAEANIDLVLSQKGSGAIQVRVADSLAAGGNKRGSYAVDLQASRAQAAQVASGVYASIGGGYDNRATTEGASVGGGANNNSSGTYSHIGGGQFNAVTGYGATIAGGKSNQAVGGNYGAVVGGSEASTRGIAGAESFACSGFSGVAGSAQRSDYVLRRTTTDATPTVLYAQDSVSSQGTPVLPAGSAFAFRALVVGRTSGNDTAAWEIKGVIKRSSGGVTAFVGTPTVTQIAADAGASAWAVEAVAEVTTTGSLDFRVTGAAATTIRWFARVETAEVVS